MTKQTSILSTTLAAIAAIALSGAGDLAYAQTNSATNAAAAKPDRFADLFGDTVVAKGKGVEVKRSQLDTIVISYKAMAASNRRVFSPEEMPLVELDILNQLIGTQLLLAKATDADRAKGKEQFDTGLQKLKAEALKMDPTTTEAEFDEKFERQLRAQGLTREQWNKHRLDQTIATVVVEREMKVNITDADAKKYYDEHPAQFEKPERVHVSHILLSTKDTGDNNPDPAARRDIPENQKQAKRKQIDEILKRARGGEDFSKLAKEFSEDPGFKVNNGEYTFSRSDPFVPEFKAAGFSLSTNQISDVVTTVYGYHVIKLLEKLPAQQTEFAEIAEKLKEYLKGKEMQERLTPFLDQLRNDAGVEILDEKLKAREADLPKPAAVRKP